MYVVQELSFGFVLEGCPIPGLNGAFVLSGEWDGYPEYTSSAADSNAVLYRCCIAADGRGEWCFDFDGSTLTDADKTSGAGCAYFQAN
eukprot:COSAG01_NODE_47058_length_394_cov_0.705085_1_plen_87_part_10